MRGHSHRWLHSTIFGSTTNGIWRTNGPGYTVEGTSATSNEDWNLDKQGGLVRSAAAMASINFMSELIATPEPGSYYLDPSKRLNLVDLR